ncbi:sulfite exporter TauE/SafE family protein [Telmatospirillum sp.]|uniref:sulfite exporter TauE/SafE family protein n=1 Tax=Telmatospirillum sp. TaxID=2079197 RepID=UPI00283ED4B1|nr:sulfite exporter TauE/SafE family protein [Telmatospirillum sp.]MDR3436893.1 sulfite exporter TauE/SafE family protein [Telmatospirillum sp.]
MTFLLLIISAFGAGLMNSVAGGGTFLTFPALVFAGVPPVMANATSTVAVFPGSLASAWAYRRDFPRLEGISAKTLLLTSLAGGICGALLLIWTPEHTFNKLIPWLLLAATILFAVGKRLTPWLRQRIQIGPLAMCSLQFLIALYGGYFGGAMGIMMLALFGLFGLTDINAMNALKTLLGGLLNAVAVVCFIAAGQVAWTPALIMLVSAVAGGYVGARVAMKMNPDHVRAVVIMIGLIMTAVFFARA